MVFKAIKGIFRRLIEPIFKLFKRPRFVFRTSKGLYYEITLSKYKRSYIELRVWTYHLEEDKYSEEDCDEWLGELIRVGSATGGLARVRRFMEFGLELSKRVELDEIVKRPRWEEIELDKWYGFVVFVHRKRVEEKGRVKLVPERFYWYLYEQKGDIFILKESGVVDREVEIDKVLQAFKWFIIGG